MQTPTVKLRENFEPSAKQTSIMDLFHEKLRADNLRKMEERAQVEQQNRAALRDSLTKLREPGQGNVGAVASKDHPSFMIGDAPKFAHAKENGPLTPGSGHLSPQASKEFFELIKQAGARDDPLSRDAATQKAAKVVANDWAQAHGKGNAAASLLHEARAQAVFVAREIGERVGLNPVTSSIVGYSLERALEKEGFRVLASHAIDKGADFFKASTASVAAKTGFQHNMDASLAKSMNWMSAHGVTRDALKDALNKHAGKLLVVTELARHPELFRQAASVLSKSDSVLKGMVGLASDQEFRKSLGTMTLAGGESVTLMHKGAGSLMILTGSMLRGDKPEDLGRHAFRAALAVAGGALGGMAGAGFASVATGALGATAGSWLADKVLAAYDNLVGNKNDHQMPKVSAQEIANSRDVLGDRMGAAKDSLKSAAVERGRESQGMEMERERSFK